MIKNVQKNIEALLDVLYPPTCVSCRAPGAWWCAGCRGRVEWTDRRDVMGFYHDPRLRGAIHALKYRGATCVLPDMVRAVTAWAAGRRSPWAAEADLALQPLITTPSRRRERGFDQSELLVETLGPILAPRARVADVLIRQEASQAQALIEDHAAREANVAGMFRVRRGIGLPKAVLLVDDVQTTGATMREAARVLREAGVERVHAFALAWGK